MRTRTLQRLAAFWASGLAAAGIGAAPYSLKGGIDLDGNGKAALIMQAPGAPMLAGRWVNNQFQFTTMVDPGSNERLVGVADFSGNGKSDLVFQNITQGDFGDVGAWIDFQYLNYLPLRTVKRLWDVQAVGDLDGDGFGDLVWRYTLSDSPDTGVSYIWFTNGSAVTQVRKRGGAPLSWTLLGAADFNNDGAADMVYISPAAQIRVLMATGNRTCANLSAGTLPDGFSALALADFSGNGRGDILLRNPATGDMQLLSLDARGLQLPPPGANPDDPNAACSSTSLTLSTSNIGLTPTDPGWQFYAAGDYNGDGVADIVWMLPDGTLAVWLMNAIASTSTAAGTLSKWNAGTIGSVPAIARAPTVIANAGTPPVGYKPFTGTTQAATSATAYTLRVGKSISGGAAGRVTSSPVGINCGSACSAIYTGGTAVSLVATPDPGSRFTGWNDACTGTAGCALTMSSARNVTAGFSPSTTSQILTVNVTGTGSGSVSSAPIGINTCAASAGSATSGTCSAAYLDGTGVTLSATAAADSTFVGWNGPCSGTGSCTVLMDSAKTVTAVFNKSSTAGISVSLAGTGSGSVASSPAGIACGGACSAPYVPGTTVVLTATPSVGSVFAGWSGACGGTGACTIFVNAMHTVVATFNTSAAAVLTVVPSGTGGGGVESSPQGTGANCDVNGINCAHGISCGTACIATFAIGTVVTLTATPNSVSTFIGWGGSCSGTGSCVVTMNTSLTVTARFDLKPTLQTYLLSVSRSGLGTGSVSSSPAGIACGASCSSSFSSGTLVTLTAVPDNSSQFNGWSGACSGTGACVVSMTGNLSVNAKFDPPAELNTLVLTLSAMPINCVLREDCGSPVLGVASGGVPPYHYQSDTFANGTPPFGMIVDLNGRLAGTPSIANSYTFKFCAVDMAAHQACGFATVNVGVRLGMLVGGAGNGSIQANPPGPVYTPNTQVTLSASPAAGSIFTGWSGACSGTGACVVNMDDNKSVTATFALQPSSCSISSIRFTTTPTVFGFVNGVLTPALGNIPITCTWAGNLGSRSTRQITSNPNGSFTCASSDVAFWDDPSITITAAVTACSNVSASITY